MGDGPIEEVLSSITNFLDNLKAVAGSISAHDKEPFPPYHPDLYQHNVIVDKDFKILSVID